MSALRAGSQPGPLAHLRLPDAAVAGPTVRGRATSPKKRTIDPRRLVTAGTFIGLAAVMVLVVVLSGPAHDARRSVAHVRDSLRVPIGHIDDAIEAGTAGEATLQRAAATTGAARNELLAQSIQAGEAAARAWTGYRAAAVGLPGEATLARRYERDYAAGKDIGAQVLVPIVRSNAPAILPARQTLAADLDRADLLALRALYQRELDATLQSLDGRIETATAGIVLGGALAGVAVLIAGLLAARMARRVVEGRNARRAAADLAEFETRLIRGLELADDDSGAFRIASRATTEVLPGSAPSVVVSDASGAAFRTVLGTMACGIDRPEMCPAIRAGSPLQFRDSSLLDACPVLGSAASAPCSVTCMPIAVAGRDAAVLQLAGPVGAAPDVGVAVRLVVRRVGERITMLRAFARFELQASRDPLTGLHNRRSLQASVERLDVGASHYAIAFIDLDHFKRLNDVHGHEAGDRALRAFARTLETSVRPEDLVCRWGGEEFIVVLPDCAEGRAVDAMDRVRASLASDSRGGSTALVTCSVGVATNDAGGSFDETVAHADDALRRAKRAGRDRVVAWTPEASDDVSEVLHGAAGGRRGR